MNKVIVCIARESDAYSNEDKDKIIGHMPALRRVRYAAAQPDMKKQLLTAQRALDGALWRAVDGYAPPADFYYLPNGKPAANGIKLSIAHTRGMAVCAAAHCDVGIDVERYDRPLSDALRRRIVSAYDDARRATLAIWVDKEAYLKLTGEGLAGGMNKYAIVDERVYDLEGCVRAYIARPYVLDYALSVCCREPFELMLVWE